MYLPMQQNINYLNGQQVNFITPFLFRRNIATNQQFKEMQQELIDESVSGFTKEFHLEIDRVKLFYDVFSKENN